MFIELLTGLVNASNHTKCLSLSNQKCEILINFHPNEYSQELHYYPFAVKLDRCVASCKTLNGLSNKVCVPNETEDLNLSVFNMITGIYESNTLTKHTSCECECKFGGRKCNSDQWWINSKCRCKCKNIKYAKNIIFGILLLKSSKNKKYLASIIDDSVITCDEIIEETKTIPTNLMKKKTYK